MNQMKGNDGVILLPAFAKRGREDRQNSSCTVQGDHQTLGDVFLAKRNSAIVHTHKHSHTHVGSHSQDNRSQFAPLFEGLSSTVFSPAVKNTHTHTRAPGVIHKDTGYWSQLFIQIQERIGHKRCKPSCDLCAQIQTRFAGLKLACAQAQGSVFTPLYSL